VKPGKKAARFYALLAARRHHYEHRLRDAVLLAGAEISTKGYDSGRIFLLLSSQPGWSIEKLPGLKYYSLMNLLVATTQSASCGR
jgi:hypothetical protein